MNPIEICFSDITKKNRVINNNANRPVLLILGEKDN